MADAIGQLGLDTAAFESATQRATDTLADLGREAVAVTGNLALMAVVVGVTLAKGIYESNKRLQDLETTLRDIKNENPFADQIVSVNQLESSIKKLKTEIKSIDEEGITDRIYRFIGSSHFTGGGGFDESEERVSKLREQSAEAIEKALIKIGQREEQNLEVLKLELAGEKERADLLKNQLQYQDKIAKAVEEGLPIKAAALKREQQITEELIRRKQLTEDEKEDGAYLLELKHKEVETAKKAAEDKARNEYRAQQDELDFRKKIQDDSEQFDKDKAKKDKESLAQTIKGYEHISKIRKEDNRQSREVYEEQKKQNEELRGQATVSGIRRSGNSTAASRERVAQEFDKKIRDAIQSGDAQGEELLRKQQNDELAKYDVAESKKTGRQRSDERAAGRAQARDEANAKKQRDDLDDKLDRGARGDKNSRLEQRREERERDRDRANNQEKVRKAEAPDRSKGYGETDRAYLKQIAEAIKVKD